MKLVKEYTTRVLSICSSALKSLDEADLWEERQGRGGGRGEDRQQASKQQQQQQQQQQQREGKKEDQVDRRSPFHCEGCGADAKAAGWKQCMRCAGHPDRNTSGPWVESTSFATLKSRLPNAKHPMLGSTRRADGTLLTEAQLKVMEEQANALRNKLGKKPSAKTGKSLFSLSNAELNNDLINCEIYTHNSVCLNVQVLVDTGATHENYANKRVAEWIWGQGEAGSTCKLSARERNSSSSILLGGTSTEHKAKGLVSCNLCFLNELTKTKETILCLKFRILDSHIDIIVGLPTIRQHSLIHKLYSHFACLEETANSSCAPAPVLQSSEIAVCSCAQPNSCLHFGDSCDSCKEEGMETLQPWWFSVNPDKWHTNKNRGPPRPQSEVRQAAIEKQVKKYLELGVIAPSTASEYSQVHLVPKGEPNDWRFCLDYVRLNEATVGVESWPIPNIPQMIRRIGSKKPRVYGVMDMTSGYHQAPLSGEAQLLSAFICFMGVFHWLRVPMGLKTAGPYFQRVMATIVLAGILYVLCELYIDDVFVFGKDDDEFVANLREVFLRFRKFNISLNPKKCRLGLESVEFVGHVISAEGITFSEEKRLKVLNFPPPVNGKQMLGFLGLVNYFRDHLPDMTGKSKNLRSLVGKNIKQKIVWTPELEREFYEVRDTVAKCPSLFFPKDELGNQFILVVVDCFSRWVELFGIPDTSAASAASALLAHCWTFWRPRIG